MPAVVLLTRTANLSESCGAALPRGTVRGEAPASMALDSAGMDWYMGKGLEVGEVPPPKPPRVKNMNPMTRRIMIMRVGRKLLLSMEPHRRGKLVEHQAGRSADADKLNGVS